MTMPFDATFLSALTGELRKKLTGSRIDKVQQPDRATVLLTVHNRDFSGKLLLCASPASPRVHLTEVPLENPPQPPMFCMLLRKYLTGSKILALHQPPMERILDFTLECTDEMGEKCQRHLIAELMGRNSNLILLDNSGRITDCLRRTDLENSSHPVLPGLFYHLPELAQKQNPREITEDLVLSLLREEAGDPVLDRWLLDRFGGLSPLVARELSYKATGETELPLSRIADYHALAGVLSHWSQTLREGRYTPTLLLDGQRPKDFSYLPIEQYEGLFSTREYDSFSRLLDDFYATRDKADRMRQKTQSMQKTVTTLYERTCRKVETQKKELESARDRERLRQFGDIITANLHAMRKGESVLSAPDFYDPEYKTVTIPLSVTLSPQQNAARYYKNYTRAKNAEKILTEQIALGQAEQEYLNSILHELSQAEREADVQEIRQELILGGYIRDTEKKRMKEKPSRPREFTSSEGFTILVGRNNRQNDFLTKNAAKTDLWLHTQKIHGSHVIILCQGLTPGDKTLQEAAKLAAFYSQARDSAQVPVDFTPVKNVKKPAGAKPGMVVYDRYNTLYLTPELCLPEN